ncbi:unnamed protein product, partial [Mesorhabditis spiculigera]
MCDPSTSLSILESGPEIEAPEEEKRERRVTLVGMPPNFYEKTIPLEEAENLVNGRWIDNQHARQFVCSLMSLLYALIITVFAIVIEISPTVKNRLAVGELKWFLEKTSHTGEGAGSLYLRLGAMFFGMIGIVLLGLEVFLLIRDDGGSYAIVQYILMIVFIFVQMHFIFCNSKMAFNTSLAISKFGMMHLVAVNAFTWLRFVIVKAASKHSKKKAQQLRSSSSQSEEEVIREKHEINETELYDVMATTVAEILETTTSSLDVRSKLYAEGFFGDITTFFVTCIVEYSLIGAAVMFIMWLSIGSGHHTPSHGAQRAKRKSRMRIDCSRSSTGLFGGILFTILAFVSIGVYSVFDSLHESKNSVLCFGIVDLVMFGWLLLVCMFGTWRMRVLQYRKDHSHHSGEMLDEILLVFGLFGEIVYCCIAIDLWVTTNPMKKYRMPNYDLPVYICRLLAVFFQAVFIMISSRLVARGAEEAKIKPGKQSVTFLLVANVALFFFHTYESMKSTLPLTASSAAYPYIMYGVSPLVVFYRFHSSVCLVDIFKRTYNTKAGDSSSSASFTMTIDSTVGH